MGWGGEGPVGWGEGLVVSGWSSCKYLEVAHDWMKFHKIYSTRIARWPDKARRLLRWETLVVSAGEHVGIGPGFDPSNSIN